MKLLIVTQVYDATHPALGFFVEWVEGFQRHASIETVQVVATNGRGSRIGRVFRFWKLIFVDRSDCVFVHMTPLWLVLGWPVWMLRGVKTSLWYTHGHGTWMLRLAVRLADVTLTATHHAFPFAHPRVKVVGHGIAPAFATVSRPSRSPDRFAFLAVGRIASRKRVRETIALFAQIHRLEPRATLTWVGSLGTDSHYLLQVRSDVHRYGLAQAVHMGDALPAQQLPRVYAVHDLLLHLSDTGSLDKVVLESLAAGCPVLSTSAATTEALGASWVWEGRLDASAAQEALQRLQAGVAPAERQRIATAFALNTLIDRVTALLL